MEGKTYRILVEDKTSSGSPTKPSFNQSNPTVIRKSISQNSKEKDGVSLSKIKNKVSVGVGLSVAVAKEYNSIKGNNARVNGINKTVILSASFVGGFAKGGIPGGVFAVGLANTLKQYSFLKEVADGNAQAQNFRELAGLTTSSGRGDYYTFKL